MTGRTVGGRYLLGELIGSGGSAAVFRATDVRLDRPVAVKVLHARLAAQDGTARAVLDEARTAARLDHPHILRVLDAGSDPGATEAEPPTIWIALDLVDGVTLGALVADVGALPIADALDIAAGVLAGLAHAHGHGIVHRDLSPANVMVPRGPDRLDVTAAVVLDLGTSSAPGSGTLVAGASSPLIRVSPHYASPELAQGLPVDARGDVYAVGALLYLMLTGAPPFDGDDPRAVLEAHVHVRPDAPSTHRAQVPRDVDALVLRVLEKDPSLRFPTADDMRVEVARCRAALALDRPTRTTRELSPVPVARWRPPMPRAGTDGVGDRSGAGSGGRAGGVGRRVAALAMCWSSGRSSRGSSSGAAARPH